MPLTRFLCVALGAGLAAWAGWRLGAGAGILPAFLCANLGLAIGWYYSRRFVRNNLD
jgi:hypothetical protein